MKLPESIRVRLAQLVGEFLNDKYRVTGRLGERVVALKHTNGNRITLIAENGSIGIIKNGKLVKVDNLAAAKSDAKPSSLATSST